MKRTVFVLITLVCAFVLLCAPISAAGNGTLSLSDAECVQGDTVTVNVNLDSNPGLITMRFTISWGEGLELTHVSDKGVLSGYTAPSPMISSPYTVRWNDSLSTADNTATGTIATLTFKVRDNAVAGNKSVSLSFIESRDTNGAKNTFNNDNATVKVNCKSHTYGTYYKVDDNNHARSCSACGYTQTREHSWEAGTVTKAANCKETGTQEYSCKTCYATKTETIAKTNDHAYGAWTTVKSPDCENEGAETRTCSVCEKTETRAIKALGHNFANPTVTKEPTCTEQGTEKKTCTRCNKDTTADIAAKGHKGGDYKVTKEATCTEKGIKEGVCSVCSAKVTQDIPAKGHTYDDGTIKKAATATETGVKVFTCTICKDEKEEVIPVIAGETAAPETEPVVTEVEETTDAPDTATIPETTTVTETTIAPETTSAPETTDDTAVDNGGSALPAIGVVSIAIAAVACTAVVAIIIMKKKNLI